MRPENAHRKNARAVAADIVREWLETRSFPDRNIERVTQDRAFVTEVVQGTIRWGGALETIARELVPRRAAPPVEAVLLTGLYELLYMDHTEAYAAVNESVEAVKALGGPEAARLVNAVLRRVLREEPEIRQFLRAQPFHVQVSHPPDLVHRWRQQFGERGLRDLCAWNNERPEVTLCVNRRLVSFGAYRAQLLRAGIEAAPHPAEPDRCLVLPRGFSVHELPGYADGLFLVQDPSTLAAPDLLAARPGERVLDLCAAPGGKTAALAEAMRGEGLLVAVDLHEDRASRLRENLARLRLEDVRVVRADAGDPRALRAALGEYAGDGFDRILLDAPCSNTGVLRRRPDARWRFSPERLRQLTATQARLLNSAASLLRPGGALVYSTCSLEPEEDEELVSPWCAGKPDYRLAKARKLFPPRERTDGAYAALIIRDSAQQDPPRS